MLEALFPVPSAERDLLSLSPEDALRDLPSVQDYSGLAVDLSGVRSVFSYKDERVSRLVWLIKEKRSPHAVRIAGYALFSALGNMAPVMPPDPPSPDRLPALLIPIPITSQRRRERGYNQCELLAEEVCRLDMAHKGNGGSNVRHISLEKSLLTRAGNSSQQKLKNRKGRIAGASGIFSVNEVVRRDYPADTPIVIMDDVITTGSTMYEAVETLKRAGFTDVRALSLAH